MKRYNFNISDEYAEKYIELFIKELTSYYIFERDICGEDDACTVEIKELLISVLNKPATECKEYMKNYLKLCYDCVNGRIEECYEDNKNLLELFKDLPYLELIHQKTEQEYKHQ